MTQNRKLLISSSKMRDQIRKSVNKVCISILNCHPENKFKIEAFWLVFRFFFIGFSLIFKKIGGGGNRKEP